MKNLSEKLVDREAEIRIMKREREEALHNKMDLTLENKRLKVLLIRLMNISLKLNSYKRTKTPIEFRKRMSLAPKTPFSNNRQANLANQV